MYSDTNPVKHFVCSSKYVQLTSDDQCRDRRGTFYDLCHGHDNHYHMNTVSVTSHRQQNYLHDKPTNSWQSITDLIASHQEYSLPSQGYCTIFRPLYTNISHRLHSATTPDKPGAFPFSVCDMENGKAPGLFLSCLLPPLGLAAFVQYNRTRKWRVKSKYYMIQFSTL